MNLKYFIGLAVAFAIGGACRLAGVPVPAPPALVGALLVVSLTLGYELGGVAVARRNGGESS
ncbi:MAG: DUF1427 family protein [Gammaproteobacteria bacterium]